jgi:hypothetical protein
MKGSSYDGRERKKEKYKMCRVVTLMSFSKSVTYTVVDSPNTILREVVCDIILCIKCKIFFQIHQIPCYVAFRVMSLLLLQL